MVRGERNINHNDKYVYYSLMERSSRKEKMMAWGMGLCGWEVDGV